MLPVVILKRAELPTAVLLVPVSVEFPALAPTKIFVADTGSLRIVAPLDWSISSPVVSPPIVRVAFRSDCIDPPPESTSPVPKPPEAVVAETDATGVAEPFMFKTANFAEEVEVAPKRRSRVEFPG